VKVGFFSPLPPARTGVADYSAALLGALRHRGDVKAGRVNSAVNLYHIGNNRFHRKAYRCAIARPGVVTLHDALLHHLFLDTANADEYIEEFVYNYGEWSRNLAWELWRDCDRSGVDPRYFRYAMLRRIAEVSRAVIVHNPRAASIVKEHVPTARVVEIPHLFHPPGFPFETEIVRLRERLGISTRTFLFAVFGYLRESKRLPVVMRAFEKVRAAGIDAALLIAGEFVSFDLECVMRPLFSLPNVYRVGHVPEREFWLHAASVDACVNLRYPSAGETSGIGVRLMGLAKPVIVTAGEECSRIPENACIRVEPGPGETEELAQYMACLAQAPLLAREIGRQAAAHIQENHSLDAVADQYWDVLLSCRD